MPGGGRIESAPVLLSFTLGMKTSPLIRLLRVLCLTLCFTQVTVRFSVAAEPDFPRGAEVVELPKYVVKDTRLLPDQERWDYVQLGNIEVLSGLPRLKTRAFLREFLAQRQVLALLWPSLIEGERSKPMVMVLCQKVDCFAEYLNPEEKGNQASLNLKLADKDNQVALIVDFVKDVLEAGDDTGQVEMPVDESDPAGNANALHPGEQEADPYAAVMEGYLRQLIQERGKMPDWLSEGILQIIADTDFDKKGLEIGRMGKEDGPRPTDFSWVLATRKLMPLEQFFKVKAKEIKGPDKVLWRAQSFAFVHLCIFGERLKYRNALSGFSQELGRSEVTEDLFKQFFGEGFKAMGARLRGYSYGGRHTYNEIKAAKGGTLYKDPEIPEIREASGPEVGRLRGQSLVAAGASEAGLGFLLQPYQAGSRDKDLLAALGTLEARKGRFERAKTLLLVATKEGTSQVAAYLALVDLLLKEALMAHPKRGLSQEELVPMLALIHKANDFDGMESELAEQAATLWLNAEVRPTREDYAFVESLSAPFEGRASVQYRLARVALQGGFMKEAAAHLLRGESLTRDPRGRALFAKLRSDNPTLFTESGN